MKMRKTEEIEKIANLLRMARKAGKISIGKSAVERCINNRDAKIIFFGKEESNFIKKKLSLCQKNDIKFLFIFNDEELAEIFGRRKLTMVSINDVNFANGINQIINKFSKDLPT